ncbi:leucine-rich repeat domain-containing protein [Chloroflexia bacterium SDU3-3]|nr:leucine-rich repeat domain-containing protein [Chloroflexia bacterium SDU3-3]
MSDLHIPDPALYRAFADALGEPITREKLLSITHLEWNEYMAENDPDSWEPVDNLTGIEHCANLRVLSFDGNSVQSIAPLAHCDALEELWLVDNAVRDLAPLRGKGRLHTLVVDMCYPLDDIAPLAGLPELSYVNIGSTSVQDITPLLDLPKLSRASLYSLKLDMAEDTANRAALKELLRRGVEIHMRDIKDLQAEVAREAA